jgi:uncharacterized protein (UPF0332 family)
MDWKECNEKMYVKRISEDRELISSLLKSSQNKFETASRIGLDDITAASKISLFYDSLREILEAVAIGKGYKIYNHDCYCAFLKEIMKQDMLSELFDKTRKIRNSINYYGKDIKADEAQEIIQEIIMLIEKTKKMVK